MVDQQSGRDDDRHLPSRPDGDARFVMEGAGAYDLPAPAWSQGGAASSDMDLQRILYALWRRKWWILLVTAIGVGVGLFLASRAEPVYETRGTLWLEPSNDTQGPIQAEDVFEGQGWADLMKSYAVLEPVVRQLHLGLSIDPKGNVGPGAFTGFSADSQTVSGSYELQVDSAGDFTLAREGEGVIQKGHVGDPIGRRAGFSWQPSAAQLPPGSDARFTVSSPIAAANTLRASLSVNVSAQSGNLITTYLEWNDPGQAARIHNAILANFMDVAAKLKSQKQREIVDILQQQTNYAAQRLDSAELALQDFKVRTITLPGEPQSAPDRDGGTTSDPLFQSYFDKKVGQQQTRNDMQRLEDILRNQQQSGHLDALALQMVPSVDQDAPLKQALQELTNQEAKKRTLLYTYTEKYPGVQQVGDQIQIMEQQTIPNLVRQLIGQLQQRMQNTQEQLASQTGDLRQIPQRTIEQGRLQRNMAMAEKLHNDLLVRLKQAELAEKTNLPNIQVVDQATVPGSPAENRGPRYLFMASLAGLGLGIAGALMFDRLDRRVRFPEQITERLGMPVLGMIPQLQSGPGAGSQAALEVLESFRAIRSQLVRGGTGHSTVILVTSPAPRDGKSLVSANLAISFASSGMRTLLMDADTRRGNAERLFNLASSPGLSDVLHERASAVEVQQVTEVEGLHFVAHGSLRGFDAELLDSHGMDDFLNELRATYDVIVVDGPPLMAGVDAMVLGERSDKVVMVIRAGVTDQAMARARLEAVGNFDFPVVGAVLNAVPGEAPYYRYHSYSYEADGEVVA